MLLHVTDAGPSPEQVSIWLEDIHAKIVKIDSQVEPLLAERSVLQERATILKELAASFGDQVSDIPDVPAVPGVLRQSGGHETVRERVHREVVDVLRQVGKPLHINDLTEEYLKRGYRIPGQGKPANVSVHLSGWKDIHSPERGIYGLTEFFNEDEVVAGPTRKKTVRRRKKGSR